MNINYSVYIFDNGQKAVIAYPNLAQESEKLSQEFDCGATIIALQNAINALENGDGSGATKACAEAFLRLGMFHRS